LIETTPEKKRKREGERERGGWGWERGSRGSLKH